jgi:biotin carboxylase
MSKREKAVIVIALRSEEHGIEYVRSLGYRVIFFSTTISIEEALSVDVPVESNLNDEDQAVAKAVGLGERFDIRAVYTLNEYRVPLAARMAATLGLSHGLPYEAALNCRSKKRTRKLLAQYGVGSANFVLVRTPAEALAAIANFSLPIVVKPCNDAGSNLVARCDTPEEVRQAVEAIQRNSSNWVGQALDSEILLEEYLEGPEFSVEACTASGQTKVLAITAKQTTPPPLAVEVGHTVPAPLPEVDGEAIRQLVVNALTALGVTDTVTHTEAKLTPKGPKVIEVNARPGGDKIPLLVKAVTGYDLRQLSLHLALGGTLDNAPRDNAITPSATVRFLAAEQDGTILMAEHKTVASMPGLHLLDLAVRNGDTIKRTTSNYNRLGYFIAHGNCEQDADQVAETILHRLAFRIDNIISQN